MRSSIYYTITFIFLIAASSIVVAALFLLQFDKQNYTNELNTKYSIVAKSTLLRINKLITKEEFKDEIDDFKLTQIDDDILIKYILENSTVLETIENKMGQSSILQYKKHNFLYIENNQEKILLKDDEYQPYRYNVIKTIFSIVFFIVLISYVVIIKKIRPLRKLKQEIDKFAKGELDILVEPKSGADEISQVANAFYSAVCEIKTLNSSRQLFLRNIMHELKTPITKGRISAEMLTEDSKQKQRLILSFERLEMLINEFALVEKITSGKGITENISLCRIIDVLDESIDIAMIERKSVILKLNESELYLKVDFKLFSVAIKNIIDNAIKYSSDNICKIIVNSTHIDFFSKGNQLDNKLSYYLEPFTQGKNNTKGFGLGLYIVGSIIKAHNFRFTYKYNEDGYNIFSIHF